MRMPRALTFVLLIPLTNSTHAQTVTATWIGTVRSEDAQPIAGARVTLRNTASGLERNVATRADGTYQVRLVPIGHYRISASSAGFQATSVDGLTAGADQVIRFDLVLRVAGVGAVVAVSSRTPLVEPTEAKLGASTTAATLGGLPVDNRDYLNIGYLSAGTFSGRRGFGYDQLTEVAIGPNHVQDNVYSVDGSSINDPTGGYGSVGPPVDALAEVSFSTHRYGAELGGGSGGVLNLVTKSGTNEVHAEAFALFQDDALVASNPYATGDAASPPSERWQVGVSGGSPLKRDAAHLFAAYEGSRADLTQYIDTGGTRPGEDGPATLVRDYDRVLAKLDASGERNRWTLTYSYGRYADRNFAPAPVFTSSSRIHTDVDTHSIAAGHGYTPGGAFSNEARLSYFASRVDIDSNGSGPFEIRPSSYTGSAPIFPSRRSDSRLQASDTLFLFPTAMPGHTFKAGLDAQRSSLDSDISNFGRGGFLFTTDDEFDATTAETYPVLEFDGYMGRVEYTTWSLGAHVTDEWRVTPRLTLHLGLRYDLETNSSNADVANPVPYLQSPDVDADNVAPRLAAAYDVTGAGRTVLRGGYGRHYTRLYGWLRDARPQPGSLLITVNPPYQGHPNPGETEQFPDESILGTDPDIEIPYGDQFSIGVDHQLGTTWAVGADYVGTRGHDEVLRLDSNAADTSGDRPHPAFGPVPVYASIGSSSYDGVQVSLRSRGASWGQASLAYTLSRSRNDHNYFYDLVESREENSAD